MTLGLVGLIVTGVFQLKRSPGVSPVGVAKLPPPFDER